ncbi:cobyric acid synthase [Paracoccus shanxieyensis]|uniref:Cobyric acid synthase n=1 Tax=Paracoccus shanxieyensis TaxID=2675752 RepID=A0A6L6IY32_9RHOB|nr:cobyric acid synthase [Paracoccus shanxieyensis]MTH64799.1 cobyric acid synthase [Paracoccus shanxieyensis]MTH87968.1 cobyric acid synthase [Paracoccus shanxieyensis]
MRAVMIQGTGSNVGKSLLVAGLCRAARARGMSVAPFKPQNMSNNAAVTADGGEIGRAQALQALAAGLEPSVHMNPVLLKPETDRAAQVIVQGRAVTRAAAADYGALKAGLMSAVMDSFAQLKARHDLIIVEGAGSPAEVNLRPCDIANMGFARTADVPVVLAGDIDRGGVIAQIVGTQAVIDPQDAAMIQGFIVNRFRGDPALFDQGRAFIAARTGWPDLGLVPWFADASLLPAEDAVDLRRASGGGALHIACPMLSRIANFDDLDPLAAEPGVRLTMVPPGRALPGDADLVILPGSKSTRGDLAFLRAQGWDIDLAAHVRRGGHVLGICGGYQMLGRHIHDPDGHDGAPGSDPGLGLLQIDTHMAAEKRLTRIHGQALGHLVQGYEIHMGRSHGPDSQRPFANIPEPDGAISADGRIMGTYLHGIFTDNGFRAAWLARLGGSSTLDYAAGVEAVLDRLARHLETHLDIDRILGLAR